MSQLGPNSEVELADADFRFTPESRHPAVRLDVRFVPKAEVIPTRGVAKQRLH